MVVEVVEPRHFSIDYLGYGFLGLSDVACELYEVEVW